MTYKNMRLGMSKNKNIFKNIDQAENLGKIRNKKLLNLIDMNWGDLGVHWCELWVNCGDFGELG